MYIAQAASGRFRIIKNLGAIEPNEAQVPGVIDTIRTRVAV
jgi:hypothetical protein